MALTPGTRIGAYEVTGQIGVGGMGEVHRARDTRLDRDVAIKILPEAFAADAERVARFQREAKVLASLNHPNIAIIHGLEYAEGAHALVMELVEGEDLAQCIARGAIPLDEALPIAKQIADALEAAHEAGIIHRDLKPANIKLRPDGTVKVLDFGLAKAMDPVADHGPAKAGHHVLSQSPTITSPAMTQAGIILGTAAYMSPEQARGKAVDRRADIWAFGCVLYEMVTARRAFEGDDIAITLAAVMMKEPNWRALPAATPVALRRLLTRCLKKDPKARMRDIGDARLQIEELLSGTPEEIGSPAIPQALSLWRRMMPWAAAGALAAALAAVLVLWLPWRTASPSTPLRLSAELGADVSLRTGAAAALSLSPDGAMLVFTAQKPGGAFQLYIRRLEQLAALPLSGTDGANNPFFSPDGQWVAFFADGKLKKIAVTGGAAVMVGDDALTSSGGTWSEDSTTITFSPQRSGSLVRVSSEGGKPEPLTTLGDGQVTHRWPQMLPGGKAVLFTAHAGISGFDDANLEVQPLPAGARKVVQRGAFYGRYLPSGHLVYIHDGTLFAAPFDVNRLAMSGPPVAVLEGVVSNAGSGAANFAVSDNGTFVYLPGRDAGRGALIEWMNREGKATPLRATPADWSNLVFAPDGHRLALDIFDGRQTNVWTYEWERDSPSRLTLAPGIALKPVWTPDGKRIVFASPRSDTGGGNLYWQRADNRRVHSADRGR